MSKYVNQIIADIKKNPKSWKRLDRNGLIKDNIAISGFGNGSRWMMWWATSIADIKVNGISTQGKTWRDCYRIEQAFIWWMRNATIEML